MFPLILLQAKAGGEVRASIGINFYMLFPLILLQAKAGGDKLGLLEVIVFGLLFPLILLQAKAGGNQGIVVEEAKEKMFPLILLQAKAGGSASKKGANNVRKCFH